MIGIILINWGVRKGYAKEIKREKQPEAVEENSELRDFHTREEVPLKSRKLESIDSLSFHLGYVGLAIGIGAVLLEVLIWIESITWGAWTDVYLMIYVPLFPLAMAGGIIVQLISSKFDRFNLLDRNMINRISGFALDLLIVSALATVSLSVIGDNFVAFASLAIAGIIWNVFAFIYLAPKMIPEYWFERGIGDFGQATGISATGLLLMRIADPQSNTPALEGFGYKQILFEPFVGGGLFTAAAVPLIYQFGSVAMLIFCTIVTVAWLLFGLLYFGRRKKTTQESV